MQPQAAITKLQASSVNPSHGAGRSAENPAMPGRNGRRSDLKIRT
jgi:hypothetical protein